MVLGFVPSDRFGARDARTRTFTRAIEDRLGLYVIQRNVANYDELERAMVQLPEHYREALRLRHQESCTFAEIGRRTGRSAEAARKVWARAVEQLKQVIKPSHDAS